MKRKVQWLGDGMMKRKGEQRVALNPLAVELYFGRSCQVTVTERFDNVYSEAIKL